MKILNWYIFRSLLTSLLLALGVLTFVMLSAHFFRAFELLTKGVGFGLLGRFLLYMIPDMLRFTVPLSMLVATVLVFGRCSSDNEISALKASGVSLWQIIAPGLLLSFCCCGICLYLSLYISPLCRYEGERLKWTALTSAPLSVLEPGQYISLTPKCQLRISGRAGDELLGVHLSLRDEKGMTLDVVAERGRLQAADYEESQLLLRLHEASVTQLQFGEEGASTQRSLSARELTLPIALGESLDRRRLSRKSKYMDVRMLFGRLQLAAGNRQETCSLLMDLHKRVSLSLSAFSFLLLGLPFGIRGRRSELSVGLLICVLLALGFYVFLLLADALEKHPNLHPEWVVWLPNIVYIAVGIFSIRRLGQH